MGKIIWLFGLLSISIVGTNSLLGYEYENYDYPTITMARNASMYDGMPFTAEMCEASECELHKGWTSEGMLLEFQKIIFKFFQFKI